MRSEVSRKEVRSFFGCNSWWQLGWRRTMTEASSERVKFEGSQPILRVEDMKRAVEFYVGKLGFAKAGWGGDDFTSVNRDGAGIYLCLRGQGLGKAWAWIGVEDV